MIKFRVWDDLLKAMEKVLVFYHNNKMVYFIHNSNSQRRDVSDVSIMQYAGLEDKNGVELYYDSSLLKLTGSDVVCWATKDDFDIPVFMSQDGRIVDFRDFFSEMKRNDFEIIGTKQENPELLQEGENDERKPRR